MSGYPLKTALLFSTQNKATLDIMERSYRIDYRLVVHASDEEEVQASLDIYRVSYVKGQAECAERPHKTIQKESLDALVGFLQKYDIRVDGSWDPVEEKESG